MESAVSLQEDSRSEFADCQAGIVFCSNTIVQSGHGAEHMIHCKN